MILIFSTPISIPRNFDAPADQTLWASVNHHRTNNGWTPTRDRASFQSWERSLVPISATAQEFEDWYGLYIFAADLPVPTLYIGIASNTGTQPEGALNRLKKHRVKATGSHVGPNPNSANGVHHPQKWRDFATQRYSQLAGQLDTLNDVRFILARFNQNEQPKADLKRFEESIISNQHDILNIIIDCLWPGLNKNNVVILNDSEGNDALLPDDEFDTKQLRSDTTQHPNLQNDQDYHRDPLGGDVFVPEFDHPAEDCSLDEWEQAIEDWAASDGTSESPLGESWNTLPFGTPGRCHKNLFVDVRRANEIQKVLGDTCKHLIHCPNTQVIVFHVGGEIGYLQWMNELIGQLPSIKQLSNPNVTIITRVSRNWSPRATQKPKLWRGAIVNSISPDHHNVAKCFTDGTHQQKRAMLKHRIWLLEELGLLSNDVGYVTLHGKQPTNPPQGSDLSFGTLSGQRINQWISRIYQEDYANDYPLGFNIVRVPSRPLAIIDLGQEQGTNNGWIASDRIAFLIDPYRWIDPNALNDCRLQIPLLKPYQNNMTPTLKQVAIAINLICKNSEAFTPSMVRQLLGRDFPTTEAKTLSAQIQPHLRTLRDAEIIVIRKTNQRKNRPYRLINRELLVEICLKDEYFIPIKLINLPSPIEDLEESEDTTSVSQDETTNSIIDIERRLMELEETVELLQSKLNAIGIVLRP